MGMGRFKASKEGAEALRGLGRGVDDNIKGIGNECNNVTGAIEGLSELGVHKGEIQKVINEGCNGLICIIL